MVDLKLDQVFLTPGPNAARERANSANRRKSHFHELTSTNLLQMSGTILYHMMCINHFQIIENARKFSAIITMIHN